MKNYLIPLLLAATIFTGCEYNDVMFDEKEQEIAEGINSLNISSQFNYSTTKTVSISLDVKTNNNDPLVNVPISIGFYSRSIQNNVKISTLASSHGGKIQAEVIVPSYVDSLVFYTDYIGLPNEISLPLNGNYISGIIGGSVEKSVSLKSSTISSASGFETLGSWNNNGLPNYLEEERDVIPQDLLDDINASLPETKELPISHPQYLAKGNKAKISLKEDAEVWVTFVHEGAGWYNTLGYYTYKNGEKPTSTSEIDKKYIIFPNVSKHNSGGDLIPGDKVYLGLFEENTVIEWFLVASGWDKNSRTVTNGQYTHYSDPTLNLEEDEDLKQHMVLLFDDQRDLLILGFEDQRRTASDQDFNDAVFYSTVNPITAVETDELPPIDKPIDTDDDDINDPFDEYPNDPNKAFDYYYPNSEEFATIAFEDLWPSKGDYDFNDLVINYQIKNTVNGDGEVVSQENKILIKAMGAGFNNGFGYELPISNDKIESINGQVISGNIHDFRANNTENGIDNACIIAFDKAKSITGASNGVTGINTTPGFNYVEVDTLHIEIIFKPGVMYTEVDEAPYNPFLVINQKRDYEVHLPDYVPTGLANLQLMNTGQDDSNASEGRYYKTTNNLPWAINIPVSFDYPSEQSEITSAYLKFGEWAESDGLLYNDWYLNENGYRNSSYIYSY